MTVSQSHPLIPPTVTAFVLFCCCHWIPTPVAAKQNPSHPPPPPQTQPQAAQRVIPRDISMGIMAMEEARRALNIKVGWGGVGVWGGVWGRYPPEGMPPQPL